MRTCDYPRQLLSDEGPVISATKDAQLIEQHATRKRVFLLGPSHHFYLPGCALTRCDAYETPLGDLKIDTATVSELHKTGRFDKMSLQTDEDEHSLEMHLPYIYIILSR